MLMGTKAGRAASESVGYSRLGMKANSVVVFLTVAWAIGCENAKTQPAGGPEAGAPPPAASTVSSAASTPKRARVFVTADGVTVDMENVPRTDSTFAQHVGALVTAGLAGSLDPFELDANRAAKPSSVVAVLQALRRANVQGAVVRTPNRDKTDGKLALTWPKSTSPDCTVVAYIAKDASIEVWPISGGTAKKYTHGFAGPDMTLGTEAVRKAASSCDASLWYVAADDAMTWGLVYDLATIAKTPPTTGPALKPTDVAVLETTPVPGNKVKVD